jgi:hypothetical protein
MPFVEEAVFSPMYVFGTFIESQMTAAVWAYFWIFYSIPLIYVSVFMSVLCCFCYFGSVIYFEVRYYISSIALFAQDCFGYLGFFVFSEGNMSLFGSGQLPYFIRT